MWACARLPRGSGLCRRLQQGPGPDPPRPDLPRPACWFPAQVWSRPLPACRLSPWSGADPAPGPGFAFALAHASSAARDDFPVLLPGLAATPGPSFTPTRGAGRACLLPSLNARPLPALPVNCRRLGLSSPSRAAAGNFSLLGPKFAPAVGGQGRNRPNRERIYKLIGKLTRNLCINRGRDQCPMLCFREPQLFVSASLASRNLVRRDEV